MEKGLVVLVDNELKLSKHVEEQVSETNRILGVVRTPYSFWTWKA